MVIPLDFLVKYNEVISFDAQLEAPEFGGDAQYPVLLVDLDMFVPGLPFNVYMDVRDQLQAIVDMNG